MFKIILCLALIFATTMFGFINSQKLTIRRKSLESIVNSIIRMKTLLTFTICEIYNIISDSFCDIKGFDAFSDYINECESFTDCWNNCIDNLPDELCLNCEDKNLLLKFAEGIGVTDLQGQTDNCELYCELFKERLISAKEKEKSSGRLYKILGFSLGFVVTLMIV